MSVFSGESNGSTGYSSKEQFSDRFIPCRSQLESSSYLFVNDANRTPSPDSNGSSSPSKSNNYRALLENQLFGDTQDQNNLECLTEKGLNNLDNTFNDQSNLSHLGSKDSKRKKKNLLRFKKDQTRKKHRNKENSSLFKPIDAEYQSTLMPSRKVPKLPFKVLDAPQLKDDFYLNLLDWSSQNILAVGLGSAVYIWSACNSKVTKLCEHAPEKPITSVKWSQRGNYLSVGLQDGKTEIWDTTRMSLVRTFAGHQGRVSAAAWNGSVIATGSRDRRILLRDIREESDIITEYDKHKQEVCGLEWSFDDQQLASGGNDNKLFIWNMHSQ